MSDEAAKHPSSPLPAADPPPAPGTPSSPAGLPTPASPVTPAAGAATTAAAAGAVNTPPPVAAQTPPHQAPGGTALEADIVDDDDGDSALDVNSVGGDSASLASSILKYRVENGRTYHAFKAGAYILPNDEIENERLDLQHAMCVLTIDNQLYTCPAGKGGHQVHRALDVGCGTGIWTMDFADEHPEAQVIGVDLSPIQPSFVPPNVSFYVDDIEAEWTYNDPFDFVHLRMMSASIQDWPKLFGQIYQNLTPGGWVELHDPVYPMCSDDGTVSEGMPVYKWSELMAEAADKMGSRLDSGLAYRQQLLDAGFTNVVQRVYKWPMNTWPKDPKHKELGAWCLENIMQGLQALSLALFTRALGWKADELELFLVDVRKDLRNRNIHGYWRIVVTYGQKPEF
ncbi:hypothetical protein RB595_009419 [Gaeumannomyces hyphopodioides]